MAAATVASSSSDATDGPVLSLINKRLRALRKKHNRILQMEESLSLGKALNKEQEETLRSKPYVIAAIDELEKLKQPLAVAVSEEINAAIQSHSENSPTTTDSTTVVEKPSNDNGSNENNNPNIGGDLKDKAESGEHGVAEDLLNLLYFGSMFDVKNQNDFTATMLTRTHERGCCLTYDYVTDDDAADLLLGERDLDLISMLGGLLISRPVNSSLSHKNALQKCIEHAKLWLAKSDQLVEPASNVTYSGLREKLNKIMASDYFTTTPEMKAPVEVAAAAGSYGSFQVPAHGSVMPVQVEGSVVQYQQKEEETANAEEDESYDNQLSPAEEFHQGETENYSELPVQNEPTTHQAQNLQEYEPKEQNYAPRRSYPNYRGGRTVGASGRRGYANGRGGRGRGGAYQNGRNQHYDQPGTYYPRNNYYRGRGGRGFNGNYNYHASQAGYVVADS
ncbi:uncharacterized protein LOC113751183 [Coffea eugenioides]|uniref:Uncharacterized protein LOC113717132 n=1 Tax=Coffea arabica TaxID=13443 RepID=A0A6P6V4D2_COFAR|nr:uncharacterized protein LOC113717132 [Coffea arabica]XP_027150886.1 uncharacterized protein LOC113751183 [Coffea eugenioides]